MPIFFSSQDSFKDKMSFEDKTFNKMQLILFLWPGLISKCVLCQDFMNRLWTILLEILTCDLHSDFSCSY